MNFLYHNHTCLLLPVDSDPVRMSECGLAEKGAMTWCKNYHDMFSHFDVIPDCDRRTERQIDRHLAEAYSRVNA